MAKPAPCCSFRGFKKLKIASCFYIPLSVLAKLYNSMYAKLNGISLAFSQRKFIRFYCSSKEIDVIEASLPQQKYENEIQLIKYKTVVIFI